MVNAAGPWTVEVDLGPQGLAAGGALKLIWEDSAGFANSSKMQPAIAEHDISITCPQGVPFTIEQAWLPRCEDGQQIICRAQALVPPHVTIAITFGARGHWRLGSQVHTYRLRVYEDVHGNGLFRVIPKGCALRCVADAPARLEATLGPPDEAGTLLLSIGLWDCHGNPAPQKVTAQVDLFGKGALEVKLDAETGAQVRVPAVEQQPACCRVTVPELGLGATSNPVPWLRDVEDRLFFGEIHCHTALSDGMRSADDLYTWARDVQRLDFAAVTDHESHIYGYSLSRSTWPLVREAAARYYEPGRFMTLLGYEWSAPTPLLDSGHHNIYFRDADGPFFTCSDPVTDSLPKLFAALHRSGQPTLVVPHHPVACKNAAGVPDPSLTVAWKHMDTDLVRLVEIYSKWGCSEAVPGDFRPLRFAEVGHSVLDALGRGYRLGFTAGSDNHTAMPGSDREEDSPNLRWPRSGLVAVYAPELTREAIFDALYARRCYATSGPRIVLDLRVNGHPMGSDIAVTDRAASRVLRGMVVGTAEIEAVEIVSQGRVAWRILGHGSPKLSFEVEDPAPLSAPVYYYARVLQADGERAWSSPIWVEATT